jgi:adenylyl- and sulfurtransferase ThiI
MPPLNKRKETAMMDTKTKEALDHARAAVQELHGAISDAAAKRTGATKADLEAVPQKAKAVIESIKGSVGVQNATAKKRLAEAVTELEAASKHAADGVKSTGKDFQVAVRQTLADARASAQKVSEAVAAGRSA